MNFPCRGSESKRNLTKACAGEKITAVTKMAGEAWKKLSPKLQQPFQKKYDDAKAKFEKEMEAFLAAGGEKQKGARALRSEKRKAKDGKKQKDPNAPKRPAGGAYGVYLAENRAKIVKSLPAGHKVTDVSKKAGQDWKALSETAKKPYEAKYQKKQKEYVAAMEEYKKTHGDVEDEDEEAEEEEEKPVPKKRARKAGA